MQSDGPQADVITFLATISACSRGRQRQLAIGFFQGMQSHVHEAKVITDCATICACSEATQRQLAIGFFKECSRTCTR